MKNTQKKIILDANAILRYIIDDEKNQADAVEEILLNHETMILHEVAAEVVYVLTKYYNQPRDKVSAHFGSFLDDAQCEDDLLRSALSYFGSAKLDFVDCILLEYSRHSEYEVFTFDKDLQKHMREG